MMKIQDLATTELLAIDHPMINRIQGGLEVSLLEGVISIESTGIATWDSLYQTFDNGFSSTSVFTMVSTTPNSSVSVISSSSIVAIS